MAAFPRYELQCPLVFVGMMGSGKSAVGSAVAELLGVPFVDSDREIETSFGMSIARIFEVHGEHEFRTRETETLIKLLTGPNCVIGGGGGLFMSSRNRGIIADKAVSVWLNVEADLLWDRVRHKQTRPLLLTDDPFATLKELLRERESSYALASLSVEAEWKLSVAEMARKVLRHIEQFSKKRNILKRND